MALNAVKKVWETTDEILRRLKELESTAGVAGTSGTSGTSGDKGDVGMTWYGTWT